MLRFADTATFKASKATLADAKPYASRYVLDVAIYAITITHIAATYAVQHSLNSSVNFNVLENTFVFAAAICTYILILSSTIIARITLNITTANKHRAIVKPNNISGFVLFLAIALLFSSFTSFKGMMPEIAPFTWDPAFAELDRIIHFKDPWHYLTFLDPFYEAIVWTYASFWHLIHIGLTLVICVTNLKIRSRYLLTYVSTWIIGGNLIPLMFMAVGPIFYERLLGDARFAELSDRLYGLSNPDVPPSLLPDMLWRAYETQTPFFGSGISAFPSLHVAISMLIFLTARSYGWMLGSLALGFLIFTLLASVNLGWHYAVDGYASILLVWGLWAFWGWVERRSAKRKAAHNVSGPILQS